MNRGKLEWKDRDVLQMSEESSSSDSSSGEDGEGIDDDELKALKNDAGDDASKQLGKRKVVFKSNYCLLLKPNRFPNHARKLKIKQRREYFGNAQFCLRLY